ncbi:MAG: SDR family oxidoreductase [Verrucomicrobiota bacterium]
MNLELTDQIVIITGGSQGIGKAITRAFASEGAIPVMIVRNSDQAEELITEIEKAGQRADYVLAELTEDACIQAAIKNVLNKYARIDVVVNNAGVNDSVSLLNTPDEFSTSINKNLTHYFSLVHYSLDALIKNKGNIINISSKVADTGQGGTSGYAASNGGINALTREWAVDLLQYGIRVNCVAPAEVLTPLYEKWLSSSATPKGTLEKINQSIPFENRTTTTDEIAATVLFLASKCASHTTGQILYPDGGYVHLDRACTANTIHSQTI